MAQAQTNNKLIYNSKLHPIKLEQCDFSDGKYESFHLEREGQSIKIVSDGIQDRDAEVVSQAKNAGLVNILKMQELRYGTVENAVARNKDKQVYADVSVIPTSVAEQAEYVAETRAAIEALCARLGISKEELLTKDASGIASLLNPEKDAGSNNEGGQQ